MSGGYQHRAALTPRERALVAQVDAARREAVAARREAAGHIDLLEQKLTAAVEHITVSRVGPPPQEGPASRPAFDTSPEAADARLAAAQVEVDAWTAMHPSWDERRPGRGRKRFRCRCSGLELAA